MNYFELKIQLILVDVLSGSDACKTIPENCSVVDHFALTPMLLLLSFVLMNL